MKSHTIIQQVTSAVLKLLEEEFKRADLKKVECLNWQPNLDKLSKEMPCCIFYLYSITENQELKERDPYQIQDRDKDGNYYEFLREPPLKLDLQYMLCAFAADPDTEQQILGRSILSLYDNSDLGKLEDLKEYINHPSDKIGLRMLPFSQEKQIRFWSALREPMRPASFYQVTIEMESERQRRFRRVEERIIDMRKKE